ncbi:hypothetical protein CBR_g4254 [Chara braunii]|uniref:Uncharacterized protein n=1 Tax=Chara braunii TaxID=69332 RepID=A0A388JR45_CHABU|nr:hypothetical protein CBR_g4254 [Chara braunii]|eukprot:GBG60299.1 hypothetical protein CBR_g4254 [Chara braunii]
MKGHSEPMIGGDEGDIGERASGKRTPRMRGGQEQGVKKRQSKEVSATTSKKARRPDSLTIREGQTMGEGDSTRLGIAAAREPSEKSKRKLAVEEDDGEKKPRRRKTGEGSSAGKKAVGRQYDEAAAFWLEYEQNDDGEIVEREPPIQLLIDPRKVYDIPLWERYYNHRSLTRDGVEDMKGAMLRQFHDEKGKIWMKNPLVLAPIYKSVRHKPERAERVHKDVFKPEDKDKYFYYPVNGQHTVAVVKELDGEQIFKLWKMHSWPARVVWFSDEDFGGYLQTTDERNWDPKRDMYWKLSRNKRTEVWDFLFQPGPPTQTDLEYNRRRNLVFGVLNGYHNARRESVSNFLKRLEHIFFLMAEPLTLENYKAQFDEEDRFDAEDMEELSDSKTFDFESMTLPRVVAQVDDEGEGVPRRYSALVFYGKHHRFTTEDVWGHNVIRHPKKFQPAVKNGKWVVAMKEADDKWSGLNRQGAGPFKKKTRETLEEHLSVMNPERSPRQTSMHMQARSSTSCTTTKCGSFERLSTNSKRHHLVALTDACRNLRRMVNIREAVEEETKETAEVTEETAQDLMEEVTEETAQDLLEEVREETTHDLPERGQVERGRRKGVGWKGVGRKGVGLEGVGRKGSRKVLEGPAAGVLETGGNEYERRASEGVSVDFETKSTETPGEEELSPGVHAVQREEETQHCQSRRVLESGASEYERHASEVAFVDSESKSTSAPGEEELSQEAHALQRKEETQHWPAREVRKGLDAGVLETGASMNAQVSEGPSVDSESKSTAAPGVEELSQEVHALQREEETQHWPALNVLKGVDTRVLETGVGEHERQGSEGEEPVVEGGEVVVDIHMDPEGKDHDSQSTYCGEEQGDRASVLGTGREMVLHEAIELDSDPAATELVSDSTVV